MMNNIPGKRAAAFTLIELLVVITIIALLTAILFPVFATAREKARQSSCVSNLKQIGLAMAQYTQDYDEAFPMYGWASSPYSYWPTIIYPYVKSAAVYHCPDDPNTKPYGNDTFVVSYGYNIYFNNTTSGSGQLTVYNSNMTNPATTLLMCDVGAYPTQSVDPSQWPDEGTVNGGVTIPDVADWLANANHGANPSTAYISNFDAAPAQRHQGYCDVLWADFHVKPKHVSQFFVNSPPVYSSSPCFQLNQSTTPCPN